MSMVMVLLLSNESGRTLACLCRYASVSKVVFLYGERIR